MHVCVAYTKSAYYQVYDRMNLNMLFNLLTAWYVCNDKAVCFQTFAFTEIRSGNVLGLIYIKNIYITYYEFK